MDFTKYLVENAYVLIPVLYILGNIMKGLELIKDKYIPILLLGLGILLSCCWLGFNVSSVIQGVLLTGITVYSNQVIKQLTKKESFISDLAIKTIDEDVEDKKVESTTKSINNRVTQNSASSKIVVDNPDNIQELGSNVNAVSSAIPK